MAKKIEPGKQKRSLLKLIDKYYADLAEFARQHVLFEMGTRHAFHRLMADAGKPHGWTLIAEQEKKVNGKTIRPDGTFKDQLNLVRGFWEAKDTDDNLVKEIEKKRKAGYPLNNIIFEDTQTAILYQHGQRILSVDMKDAAKLAELVVQFFQYIEPEIEEFEQAVEVFKERVPDLAEGLAKKIDEAHRTNPAFKRAFADFFELCQSSLNPNISQAVVDEMLIQHILTERLIREIFDNPEFVRRNVIAAEVEKVMLAMTSHSFDRNTYLRDLDRFYVAIEHAARTMTDWSDKQYFLNTVYERFFQGYSVKLADTMGIVYTPQEIVDFICTSVAEVLDKEFGKKLWSDDVYIIDPCTGTGNFIVNLIRRIPKAKLEDVYKHRLFANEIMLLPYYIAALNIEHAYWEQAGKYDGFEGLCFVDTLDLAEHAQGELGFMTAANTHRVERQRRSPITVVIGNPPYNVGQMIHNERNKNRAYAVVDRRVKDTYSRDSMAKSRSKLADPYVKFFRWATDRLEDRDGIVCFVSNNSYIDQIAFDGMRQHLHRDFDRIYILNLQGNVRRDSMRDGIPLGERHTVFGLAAMVGVSVCVLVKSRKLKNRTLKYHSVHFRSTREEKFAFLTKVKGIQGVQWATLTPNAENTWLVPETAGEYSQFVPIASRAARSSRIASDEVIFKDFTLGVATHRDPIVYDFSSEALSERVAKCAEDYNVQVDRWKRAPQGATIDSYVSYDTVVWDADLKLNLKRGRYAEFLVDKIVLAQSRPFCRKWLFFDRILNSRVYGMLRAYPIVPDAENRTIIAAGYERKLFSTFISDRVTDLNFFADPAQCFPFYVYDEDGTNRRENITDWALKQFRDHYKDKKIDKWAIFHYVYGLLHHPGYREKFADNLKRELPRIPFAPEFRPFAKAGEKLAKLHLDYEKLKPWELEFVETPRLPLSYRIEGKMRLSKDKLRLKVNPSLTLAGIPPEAFDYRLGNRSALEWVIDQYQVSTHKRSSITSDPNREDDPEYIVRLVGQVIRVSVETVAIVNSLPAYSAENT